jgi:hypothetical protein
MKYKILVEVLSAVYKYVGSNVRSASAGNVNVEQPLF